MIVDSRGDRSPIAQLIESARHPGLNAVDRAQALRRIRVAQGLRSWGDVARLVGLSRQHVYNLLSVGGLPDPIRDEVREGGLTAAHGRALHRLQDLPQEQLRLRQRIHSEGMSARTAAEAAREILLRQVSPRTDPNVPRQVLRSTVDELMVTLMAAAPEDVDATRTELIRLHHWLSEHLTRRSTAVGQLL